MWHLLSADFPTRVKNFMPAMLGVGLGEHHQFDVVWVAPQFCKLLAQIIDLVFGQRKAQRFIRLL